MTKRIPKRFKDLIAFMMNNTDWRVADCFTESDIKYLKSILEENK